MFPFDIIITYFITLYSFNLTIAQVLYLLTIKHFLLCCKRIARACRKLNCCRISYRINVDCFMSWWRHQMETFSALLAICAGNSPVPGEFPTQRPVARSFDVNFDLRPDKRLSKQSWGWWFETLSYSLWRHRNVWHVIVDGALHLPKYVSIFSDFVSNKPFHKKIYLKMSVKFRLLCPGLPPCATQWLLYHSTIY